MYIVRCEVLHLVLILLYGTTEKSTIFDLLRAAYVAIVCVHLEDRLHFWNAVIFL